MNVLRLPSLQKYEETLNMTNRVLGLEARTRSSVGGRGMVGPQVSPGHKLNLGCPS